LNGSANPICASLNSLPKVWRRIRVKARLSILQACARHARDPHGTRRLKCPRARALIPKMRSLRLREWPMIDFGLKTQAGYKRDALYFYV
jgi:hypothetical protein